MRPADPAANRTSAGSEADDQTAGAGTGSIYDRDLDWSTRMRMGLAEVCSRLPGHLLPGRSGLGATLMVGLDLDTLLGGIKAATLSTGTRISASQARLMAMGPRKVAHSGGENLGLIPQVLGGKSVPLDHGHEQRYFPPLAALAGGAPTRAQKQALATRDGGCTAPGCDRPPEQCEGHHWRLAWSHGATATLDDGVLICPFHHRRAHDENWQARLGPDGHIQWRRPGHTTWHQNQRYRP